ncbi:MAG: hypothetical protein LBU85_09980 [Treponema sp.]|jgi:hypothetical protein|nr:hypothetical protein [Treponema sp.]
MKRLLLVLCTGLLLNVHVLAQWDDGSDDYNYDGYDYDYDSDSGDYYQDQPAAGASGTTDITVRNSGAEEQSEQKLTLPNSQPIYLYFYNNVQNPPAPEKTVQSDTQAQPAPPPPEPEPAIEYRYIPLSPPEPPPVYTPPPVEYRYIPLPQVEYVYIPMLPPEPVYTQPPPMQIRVIPGLPDPNSPRIYRLQVGSYAVHNTADLMAQRLMAAGLQAGIEYYNSLKRVFVPGVRAADACTIVQLLEALGFAEVWIRE